MSSSGGGCGGPPPADDEVRIRTLFAAVNRADVEIRRGEWRSCVPIHSPGELRGRALLVP